MKTGNITSPSAESDLNRDYKYCFCLNLCKIKSSSNDSTTHQYSFSIHNEKNEKLADSPLLVNFTEI